MLREQLKQAGFSDEQIEKIMKLHQAEIDGNFIPKHRFDEINEANKTLKQNLADRDKQIEGLKGFKGTAEELEKQVKELQEENKKKSEDFEAQLKDARITTAIKLELAGKVYDADMVSGLIDKSKIELDDKGNIKSGFKEQFDTLKKDKAFLFIPEKKDDKSQFGWKPRGTTPSDGSDSQDEGDDTPEAFGKNLAKNIKSTSDVVKAANDYYFKGGN